MMLGNIFIRDEKYLLVSGARASDVWLHSYEFHNLLWWEYEEDEYKTQNTQHRYHNLLGGHKVNDIQTPA